MCMRSVRDCDSVMQVMQCMVQLNQRGCSFISAEKAIILWTGVSGCQSTLPLICLFSCHTHRQSSYWEEHLEPASDEDHRWQQKHLPCICFQYLSWLDWRLVIISILADEVLRPTPPRCISCYLLLNQLRNFLVCYFTDFVIVSTVFINTRPSLWVSKMEKDHDVLQHYRNISGSLKKWVVFVCFFTRRSFSSLIGVW